MAVKFKIGQLVWRVQAPKIAGVVTGILFRPTHTGYYAKFGTDEETHCFDVELRGKKPEKEFDLGSDGEGDDEEEVGG